MTSGRSNVRSDHRALQTTNTVKTMLFVVASKDDVVCIRGRTNEEKRRYIRQLAKGWKVAEI